MVAIVLNELVVAAAHGRLVAVALKTPPHAGEARQRAQHGLVRNTQLHRHGDGRERVEHVVLTRQVQHHLQVGQGHAIAPLHGEAHASGVGAHVDGTHLRILAEAVAGYRARHVSQDLAHAGVVHAQDGRAVERHAVQEVHERLLEAAEVVAVGFHVVGVNVGDHGHHGQQVEERGIGLVGLDHDVLALAQPRVGTGAVQAPADDEGRVQPRLGQHAGDQAGGRRLAVRASDGHALAQAHQLGQHERARHHGNLARARSLYLGVVALHGRGGHHGIGPLDVGGVVAHMGGDAQALQAAQRGAVRQVRARHLVAQVVQHLGDAAHAGAAHADEVNVTDSVFHGASSSQAATTAAVASVFCIFLAFCAR